MEFRIKIDKVKYKPNRFFRSMDWYVGGYIITEETEYETGNPIYGFGSTPEKAIKDLMYKLYSDKDLRHTITLSAVQMAEVEVGDVRT
jgi:hypothetical protein